ncbi:MAG: Homeodomain-like protein [Linnemannia gamsii]|nr:MAG: Homeodomain-like protein [Linnemannia gamsii]
MPGARPAFTIPTPVTITSSTATRVRHGPRHVFSTAQKEYLESNFQRRSYPDKAEVEDMADKLSVTDDKIRNWFTNRRFKEKKTTEAEVPSRETSPVQTAPTRSTLSSVSIGPQAQTLAARSIAPHRKSLTLSR